MLSYFIIIRACRNEKRSMKCQVLSPHCTKSPSHRSHDFHYLRVDSFCFFLPSVRAPSVSFGSHLTLLSATVGFLESTESLFCFGDQVRPNGDGKLRTFPVFVARLTGTPHNNKTGIKGPIDLSDGSFVAIFTGVLRSARAYRERIFRV